MVVPSLGIRIEPYSVRQNAAIGTDFSLVQVGRCSIFVIPRISAGSPANATQRDAEHRHRSLKDRYAISVRANRYWKQPIFNTPELAGLPAGRAVSAIASSACGSTRTRARPTYPAPFAPGSSPTTGQPGRLCRGDPPRRSGPRNSSRCGSMSRIKAAQSAGVCGPGYACSHRPLHDTTCHILGDERRTLLLGVDREQLRCAPRCRSR